MLAQAELRDETEPTQPTQRTPSARPAANRLGAAVVATPEQRTAIIRQVRAPDIRVAIAPRAIADLATPQTQPLTGPHRPQPPQVSGTVATEVPLTNYASLRRLVGSRNVQPPLDQVMVWHHKISDAPLPPVATIGEVVAQASAAATYWEAARFGADTDALLRAGDVVVFDRAVDDAPASLIGLVAATDVRGVSEFFYVAAGVIRRGFIDPKRPTLARDAERRIVNTFLRHKQNQPPAGTRFLTGELFAGAVRL